MRCNFENIQTFWKVQPLSYGYVVKVPFKPQLDEICLQEIDFFNVLEFVFLLPDILIAYFNYFLLEGPLKNKFRWRAAVPK